MRTCSFLMLAVVSFMVGCSNSDDEVSVGDHGTAGAAGAAAGSGQAGSAPAGTGGTGQGGAGANQAGASQAGAAQGGTAGAAQGGAGASAAGAAQGGAGQGGNAAGSAGTPAAGSAGTPAAGSAGASGQGGSPTWTPCFSAADCPSPAVCDPNTLTCSLTAACEPGATPDTCPQGQACGLYTGACFDTCVVSDSNPQSTCPSGFLCTDSQATNATGACVPVVPVKQNEECHLGAGLGLVVIPCENPKDQCVSNHESPGKTYCRALCDVTAGSSDCEAGLVCNSSSICLPPAAIDPAPIGGQCKEIPSGLIGSAPCGPIKNGIAQGDCESGTGTCRQLCTSNAESPLVCPAKQTCQTIAQESLGRCY